MERICAKCGHVNRAAGLFCAKCGVRMSGPPTLDAPRRPRFHFFRAIASLIKLAITIAVIAFLVLLLWPPAVPAPVVDPARADAFEQAVGRLLTAIEQRRPAAEVISDADVNAYLSRQLAITDQAGTASGLRVALRQIRVDFFKERARVTVDTAYGPLRIVMAVTGRPIVGDGAFSMQVEETKVGRIPFPLAAGGWVADKIRSTVEGLERERELLNRITQLDLADGKARLMVRE